MRIGLTYDRPSHQAPTHHALYNPTVGAIEQALGANGHEVVCIGHAMDLVDRLAAGGSMDMLFNYCSDRTHQVLVAALAAQYGIPTTFAPAAVLGCVAQPESMQSLLRDRGVVVAERGTSGEVIVAIVGTGSGAEVLGTSGSHETVDSLVEQSALQAWRVLQGCDAGCVRLKMEADGAAEVVDVQLIPELCSRSPLVALATQHDISFSKLLARIVQETMARSKPNSASARRPHMLQTANEKSEI